MLGVSVSALDCKQWNPPLSYYLKQKASLKVTHSTKGAGPDLDHSRNQETKVIRKARKLRDDNCLLSSSSLGRMPSAADAARPSLVQIQSPE